MRLDERPVRRPWTEDELTFLGLSSTEHLSSLGEDTAPAGAASEGLSTEGGVLALSQSLAGRVAPSLTDVELPPLLSERVRVRRWTREPHVCTVEARDAASARGLHEAAGLFVVDDRENGLFRVSGDLGDHVLRFEGGAMSVHRVGRYGVGAATACPSIALDDVIAALQVWTAPAWLLDAVRVHARATDGFRHALALGMIARLWTPAKPNQTTLDALVAGEASPSVVASACGASLSSETRARLHDRALHAVDGLHGALHSSAGDAVRALRDDLACIAVVLGATALGDALVAADREAVMHLTGISCADEVVVPERLRAVAWQEPEAWWGRLPP